LKNKLGAGGANFIARPRAQSCLATPLALARPGMAPPLECDWIHGVAKENKY